MVSTFQNGNFALKTSFSLDSQKYTKTKNWRHNLVKRKKVAPEYLGWLNKQFPFDWKIIGMIQTQLNWEPYELKPKDNERRYFAYKYLIQRQQRKSSFR